MNIKYLVSDCDGVLTDGKYYYSSEGKELITFNTKDSTASMLMKSKDYDLKYIVISSATNTSMIEKRMEELGVDFYRAGVFGKVGVLSDIVDFSKTAYIGDSLDDLPVFDKVAVSFAPADAVLEVRDAADFVLYTRGGNGCVLEAFSCLRDYENYVIR